MRIKIVYLAILALLLAACDYIVTPEPEESSGTGVSTGWSGIVTAVEKSGAGDLHVEFTLRNDSGDWSALQAAPTATLTGGDGKTSTCETVFAGSGGHRLAPGFHVARDHRHEHTVGRSDEPHEREQEQPGESPHARDTLLPQDGCQERFGSRVRVCANDTW